MLPTAVLLLLAKATVVLVAALGITRVLQRAAAGARHLVWLATLGALLLVPALGAWGPLRLAILPAVPAVGAVPAAPEPTGPVTQRAVVTTAPASSAAAGRDAAQGPTPNAVAPNTRAPDAGPSHTLWRALAGALAGAPVVPAALALWAAVALAIGAALAASWLAVRRLVRRARPLDTPDWRDPLWEIADRLGLDAVPRLVRSDDARMPFACGLRRPTIVLPAASDGWTPDRRRAVLLHELAHVRRRDLAGHTLARLVCAVYWFHPLVWTAAKRLRAESERACDDLALASGARAADYAEHLLDIVTSVRRDRTPVVALAMARRTEFEGRMLDILDPERPRATPGRRQSVALVGVLALITVVVGAAAPAPATRMPETARAITERAEGPERIERSERPERSERRERLERPAPEPAVARVALGEPERVAVLQAAPGRVTMRVELPGLTAAKSTTVGAAGSATAGNAANAAAPNAPYAAVDARALHALAERGPALEKSQPSDERADLLARVLRTDTSASLRRIAAWGLAEYAERPAAAAALAAALRGDGDADVRERAAWALANASGSAAAEGALAAALRADADARVRARTAWALGTLGSRASADALAAALADPGVDVRTRAAWALGSVGIRQAPRALIALLGDPEPGVRERTAWALFSIADPAAAPALQAALRAERDPKLQAAYVRALGALGEQSVDALRGLLESPDARVRAAVVRALAGGRASGPWPQPWPEPRPFP